MEQKWNNYVPGPPLCLKYLLPLQQPGPSPGFGGPGASYKMGPYFFSNSITSTLP
jgi:hypothetical protein